LGKERRGEGKSTSSITQMTERTFPSYSVKSKSRGPAELLDEKTWRWVQASCERISGRGERVGKENGRPPLFAKGAG